MSLWPCSVQNGGARGSSAVRWWQRHRGDHVPGEVTPTAPRRQKWSLPEVYYGEDREPDKGARSSRGSWQVIECDPAGPQLRGSQIDSARRGSTVTLWQREAPRAADVTHGDLQGQKWSLPGVCLDSDAGRPCDVLGRR
ncbi:hypothetical protein NDU88_002071 [Pleurodeles waltl]|uniref:Uncharacterized protein n=1 Tax=Pleurodeles waltl TaxID=8319 RepID=A0AAV7W304_PLEWA|nr:hypothetical protein NDU88_002071 [Pleurodeles waltl]